MTSKKIILEADPTKDFFIEMLTRDITLINCILDLIDNSIDSILHKTQFDPMKGLFKKEKKSLNNFKISIIFNKNEFQILDNSIGISENDAHQKVFRFGTPKKYKKEIGLSVYGIGMKRAFLKMGKSVLFETVNDKNHIKSNIDVLKWMKDKENWDFEGEVLNKKKNSTTGTLLKVTQLYDQISNIFDNEAFLAKLINRVSKVYAIFLANNLAIEINGVEAKPEFPKIAQTEKLKPAFKTVSKNGIKIKIIAGLTHEDSKSLNGWYVFCNGRMILDGDKTEKTGWGSEHLRKFHSSTNRFVGFVYFESDDVSNLPWTTTKDDVNYDSTIYQYALNEMVKVARPVVTYLTRLYRVDRNMSELRKMVKLTDEISIENLKTSNRDFVAPEITETDENENNKQKITYQVPNNDLVKIKEIIGNKNISKEKIGEKTFYYFIENEE